MTKVGEERFDNEFEYRNEWGTEPHKRTAHPNRDNYGSYYARYYANYIACYYESGTPPEPSARNRHADSRRASKGGRRTAGSGHVAHVRRVRRPPSAHRPCELTTCDDGSARWAPYRIQLPTIRGGACRHPSDHPRADPAGQMTTISRPDCRAKATASAVPPRPSGGPPSHTAKTTSLA